MNTTKCFTCEAWEMLVKIARDERDDAQRERGELDEQLARMRVQRDDAHRERVELREQIARMRVQLRDEERENAALRRRLREGGR